MYSPSSAHRCHSKLWLQRSSLHAGCDALTISSGEGLTFCCSDHPSRLVSREVVTSVRRLPNSRLPNSLTLCSNLSEIFFYFFAWG